MKRKYASIVGIIFIVIILGILVLVINGKQKYAEEINYNAQLFDKTIYNQPIKLNPSSMGTILVFFTTECEFCKEELNFISRNYKKLKKISQIIFISYEDNSKLQAYFQELRLSNNGGLNVISDPGFKILDYYKVKGFPTTLIFDPEGNNLKIQSREAISFLENKILVNE